MIRDRLRKVPVTSCTFLDSPVTVTATKTWEDSVCVIGQNENGRQAMTFTLLALVPPRRLDGITSIMIKQMTLARMCKIAARSWDPPSHMHS